MNIKVLPPSINSSDMDFTVEGENIRMGLNAIKNVGSVAIDVIMKERELGGNFTCLSDFIYRTTLAEGSVTVKDIEWLIKAGALDEFKQPKSAMVATMIKLKDEASKYQKKIKDSKVINIFNNFYFNEDELPPIKEYPKDIALKMEKTALGIYMSGHPLNDFRSFIAKKCNKTTMDFQPVSAVEDYQDGDKSEAQYNVFDGEQVKIAGIVNNKRVIVDKNGNQMAFLSIEDMYGSVDITIFASQYENCKHIKEDDVVYVVGRVSHNSDFPPSILVNRIDILHKEDVYKNYVKADDVVVAYKLRDSLSVIVATGNCTGNTPLYIESGNMVMLLPNNLWLNNQGLRALKQRGFEVSTVKE